MVSLTKIMALGGLCALLGSACTAAVAQDWRPDRMDRGTDRITSVQAARHELQVLHRVYDHEIRSGHPEAAMRAHMRAERIRARLREHRWGSSRYDR